ncbi:MAG: DUF192 domain-containing protein [Candidatus Diapherotrites archaeon]|nr:DUF192 domain-containing protein [Candidatus Diapherotrites archaeon]
MRKKLKMSIEFAHTPWQKFKGLMLRKDFDGALIFVLNRKTRIGASIHTMFMRFPIDILFLDEKHRVVDIARNVKPWTLNITPKKPCRFVIEMKAGKARGIKIGDSIRFSK